MLSLLAAGQYAPFGNNSLAAMDADIQYLDFFAYFKDVLSGKNNIAYTLGKTLGGTNIAVFSYYLSSPFSLLLVFFSKDRLETFFDFVVTLQLMTCALTFCNFTVHRFRKSISSLWKKTIVVVLSVSYALCQYCIAQSSNIMWLDGVYLLPLFLLQVYRVANGKKVGWKLAGIVGISIFFNWYTAGINCLFSIGWFWAEYALQCSDQDNNVQKRIIIKRFLYYVGYVLLGVMISAALFLPTIASLKTGSRSSLDWGLLENFGFNGTIPSVITKYVYGGQSDHDPSKVALFAGCIAAIGFVSTFITKKVTFREKIVLGIAAVIGLLMIYWNPLFVSFSLFKDAASYWFRYSYLNEFLLLFIASYYLIGSDEADYFIPVKSSIIFGTLLILVDYISGTNNWNKVYATAAVAMIEGWLLSVQFCQFDRNSRRKRLSITVVALIAVCMVDLLINTNMVMRLYHASDVRSNASYNAEEQKLVDTIKNSDPEPYRITQTMTRNQNAADGNLTANYNESLAFDYWSLSGYTSAPDDRQRNFPENLGYRENGYNFNITNTSILAADSLLGVKYVLSEYPIQGLIKRDDLGSANGKNVYENPYALPMTFRFNGSVDDAEFDRTNPFEYQNSVYSKLLNRNIQLYKPIPYDIVQQGDEITGESLKIEVYIPNGDYAIYGNIPWNSDINAQLNINNEIFTSYGKWLSPSVFYIPSTGSTASIELTSAQSYDIKYDEIQFYALDLNLLSEITTEFSSSVPENVQISNGKIIIDIDQAQAGDSLFLSIPFDRGWMITNNDSAITAGTLDKCLNVIKLNAGHNHIVMKYSVPGQKVGIVVTILGILFTAIFRLHETGKLNSFRERNEHINAGHD